MTEKEEKEGEQEGWTMKRKERREKELPLLHLYFNSLFPLSRKWSCKYNRFNRMSSTSRSLFIFLFLLQHTYPPTYPSTLHPPTHNFLIHTYIHQNQYIYISYILLIYIYRNQYIYTYTCRSTLSVDDTHQRLSAEAARCIGKAAETFMEV